MPGILPPRLITTKIGTSSQSRIAQACDRCRSKKIRCDGVRPSCTQCTNVGFECKTSDKLSRRAFPRGYTESLEERVRGLETEVRELKDLLDMKDEKIDMLSRMHSPQQHSARRLSTYTPPPSHNGSDPGSPTCADVLKIQQMPHLIKGDGAESIFMGSSSTHALLHSFGQKLQDSGKTSDMRFDLLLPQHPRRASSQKVPPAPSQLHQPPRVVSDQMINIFFQEWAPLFPVLHRPAVLESYEQYLSGTVTDKKAVAQLNLIFCLAAISSERGITYDVASCERQWIAALSTFSIETSLATVQCLILAQIYCMQKGDYNKMLHYRSLAVGTCQRLGLQQAQKRLSLTPLELETRKKVFWTLYTVDCFVSVVLGLPRMIRTCDVDCEFPVDADDEFITESGFRTSPPGESTKISSALALFRLVRVLGRVLEQNYPTASSYEIPVATIAALEADLEDWSSSLPSHLQLTFEKDKPSTNIISSRCPLLALAYHYTRALIHRPIALAPLGERSSVSIMALAACSKHTVQILELLEERNLTFSMCLNKNELAVMCGFESLLQAIDLPADSKLLQESQKTTFSIMGMLTRSKSVAANEFKRVAGAAMGLGNPAYLPRSNIQQSLDGTPALADTLGSPPEQLKEIANRYRAAVASATASRSPSLRSTSLQPGMAGADAEGHEALSGLHASLAKRSRLTMPLPTQNVQTSCLSSSWTPEAQPLKLQQTSRRQTMSSPRDAAGPNLDFFAFSDEPQPVDTMPANTGDPMSLWLTAMPESVGMKNEGSTPLDWLSLDEIVGQEGGEAEMRRSAANGRSWSLTLGRYYHEKFGGSHVGAVDETAYAADGVFGAFDFDIMDGDTAQYAIGLAEDDTPRHESTSPDQL